MASHNVFAVISCLVFLAGCTHLETSDVVSPPVEDHPQLKTAEMARLRGDVPQAIHDYRNIIKESPKCEKAYVGLGMSLIDANEVTEAKHTFEKASALFPKSPDVLTGMGISYLLIDQPEKAMCSFEAALKIDARNARALNSYGIAYDMKGNHKCAQANYRAAMEIAPGNISYEGNLALSLALSGQEREAIRILERLCNCPQVTPRIRQNLALAYGIAGDVKMAKKVGRIDLSDDMVMNNMSYMEAIRQTKEYAGLIPKNYTTPIDETRKWQEK